MTISIIICAYNEEGSISRCIDSVITQTYSNWELWIVNDGSTDSTSHIVQQYVEQDQRIHLHSQENQGLSSARKSGIRCATGEHLIFIDADDYVGEQYIEHFLETLHFYPEAECIQGGYIHYENGNVTTNSAPARAQYPPSVAIALPFLLHFLCGVLWKTSFLKQHLDHIPEHLNVFEDIITKFQLYPHLKSVCVSASADYHRIIHGQNMCRACYSVKTYAQVATEGIHAINHDYWKKSKLAFRFQCDFLALTFKAVVNSSLSTQQSISLLQQLPTPLLSRRFFSRSLGYGNFILTWLLKHKHYKTLLAFIKLRLK